MINTSLYATCIDDLFLLFLLKFNRNGAWPKMLIISDY